MEWDGLVVFDSLILPQLRTNSWTPSTIKNQRSSDCLIITISRGIFVRQKHPQNREPREPKKYLLEGNWLRDHLQRFCNKWIVIQAI
jgi:hypothetical protein